jgi:DDE superfamily endonuclease
VTSMGPAGAWAFATKGAAQPPAKRTWPHRRPLKRAPALLRKIQSTHKNKRIRLFFQTRRDRPEGADLPHLVEARQEPTGPVRQALHVRLHLCLHRARHRQRFRPRSALRQHEAMQQFLDHLAATIGKDEHAVMVLDQAGWHDSRALSVPANLTLVPLPPYSPELNPVERVWRYLKERSCHTDCMPSTRPLSMRPARPGDD